MHRFGFYIFIILCCSLSGVVAQTADSLMTSSADSLATGQFTDSTNTASATVSDSLATTDSLKQEQPPMSLPEAVDDLVQVYRPLTLVRAGIADSSLYKGTDYGNLGDVFDWMPGTYYYDRGSIGQVAYGSLFAGLEGQFELVYDGLYLNNPFTGLADMNVIPVESVRQMQIITSGVDRQYGNSPVGQSMQISSIDIAGLPIHSQVSYRTGHNGFDDIDARMGIKSSNKMSINMGGIIKGYGGTFYNSKYDANKLNLKIERRLGHKWNVRYLYLRNKAEADVPVFQALPLQKLSRSHTTDYRSDHGVQIARGRSFITNIQHTFYRQESPGYWRADINNLYKCQGTRVTSQYQKEFGVLTVQSGAVWQINHLKSANWGNHVQRNSSAWLNAALRSDEKFYFSTGLMAQYDKGYGLVWQPEASVEYRHLPNVNIFSWINQGRSIPSFEALYSNGPYALGNSKLGAMNYTQAGLGITGSIKGIELYVAASMMNVNSQNAIYASDSIAVWFNQIDNNRFAVDFAITCPLGKYFSVTGKGKYNAVEADDPYFDITNLPSIWGKGYLQYRRVFFRRDLDTQIRFGALFMGESFAPEYYFAQYPLGMELFGPAVVPFVQVTLVVRSMTLFIAMQNIPALEVDRVYGWNLPKSQLRWGFTWNFVD